MSRGRGGYIGFNRVPAAAGINSAAVGVWTLREAEALKRAVTWPRAAPGGVGAGLQLWLDAADANTLYDATTGGSLVAADGTVKRWEDKSGNARHATEATNGPQRKTGQQNQLDAILFDGINDALTVGYNITGLSAITIFAVAKNAGTLSDNPDVLGNYGTSSGTDGLRVLLGYNNAAVAVGGRPTSALDGFATADSGTETLNFVVATAKVSNGSVSALTNGGELATTTFTAGALVGESSIELAHLSAFSNYRNIYIAEIIIYDTALSDASRQAVENYLLAKWGIT